MTALAAEGQIGNTARLHELETPEDGARDAIRGEDSVAAENCVVAEDGAVSAQSVVCVEHLRGEVRELGPADPWPTNDLKWYLLPSLGYIEGHGKVEPNQERGESRR